MMAAWYFCHRPGQAVRRGAYLRRRRLDRWTHNKTIQKAVESYRITPEQKDELRACAGRTAQRRRGYEGPEPGLFLCLFLGIACFSGISGPADPARVPGGADAYFKLEQFVSLPPASEETEETPAELAWPEVDFTALAAVNPDVTAWLYGPDTGISYPVVQGRTMTITWIISWTARPTAPGAFCGHIMPAGFFWPQHGDLRPSDEKRHYVCRPGELSGAGLL